MGSARKRRFAATLALALALRAGGTYAGVLADTISVSGDSISRAFDANTSSCNYGDNVTRAWATGDSHGTAFCSAGSEGTFSHAERLECAAGADITNFNDAASGADMLSDFYNQAVNIQTHLSANLGPRYVPVFMGHNDVCTNTTNKTGNSCSGDQDPNNYCRTTPAAFEREFRRGMDQLIQIPQVRILVAALARVSMLCTLGSKTSCGVGFGVSCNTFWSSGFFNVCKSLTIDCSSARKIDAYNQVVAYNEILSRVAAEYAAIPAGGTSATGAVKADDVVIRYGDGVFNYKFQIPDLSCCDCFHPSDLGQEKLAEYSWNGLQCSAGTPCCAPSGDPLTDANCGLADTSTFYPGFWANCTSAADCDDHDPCTTDTCDAVNVCEHTTAPDGTACSDGNACTQTDTCQAGVCTGTNPITCPAPDQCHVVGTCNPATGICSDPAKPDGSACNDGSACTQTDTCQGGVCTGTNPVTCPAPDQCHVAGTCNPATGLCSNPAKPDGSACNDGDACTQTDTCQGGTCTGTNPVTCPAPDQCHVAGTCDPATGVCSNPAKPDASACNDGDACTQTDTCQGGTCTGTNPVTCPAPDQCHVAGTCNPATGVCSNPAKPDGSACSDGSACTQTDTCQSGTCIGSNPVTCPTPDQCHLAGTCNPSTGVCSNPAKPDGSACSDGDACTQTDTCQGGACTGANPVVCTALDQCHVVGTCNPATGVCSNPTVPDGSACNDGDACTQTDACQGGTCTGANPVTCPAPDQCHVAGTCNPATGVCSNPAKPDGSACNDDDACTQTDACHGGICTGTNPVTCPTPDQCHDSGACDPQTGTCSNPAKPDGTACDDGNACTLADRCTAGVCGGDPSCGDGVVQPGCGETCDDGAGNGTDHCCSAGCQVVDTDGDGICDRDDPCTGGVPVSHGRLALGKLSTPPGDDTLNAKGEFTLASPVDPALDPLTHGVRFIVNDTAGAVLDVTLPGGAYANPPGRGWRVNGNHTRWTWVDLASGNGISKLGVQDRSAKTPGLVRFSVKGKAGSFSVPPTALPLNALLVLDPPSAMSGECGQATFPGPRPAPTCSYAVSGSTVTCR